MQYTVTNIAGGTAYQGRSLAQACASAVSDMADGYIVSSLGRCPVLHDFSENGYIIGECGQCLDDLRAQADAP